jgi:hypothetical protein
MTDAKTAIEQARVAIQEVAFGKQVSDEIESLRAEVAALKTELAIAHWARWLAAQAPQPEQQSAATRLAQAVLANLREDYSWAPEARGLAKEVLCGAQPDPEREARRR